MCVSEFERRCEFFVGSRLGTWDWEDEDLGASLASGGEVDVLVVFGELQEHVSSHSGETMGLIHTVIEDGDLSQ